MSVQRTLEYDEATKLLKVKAITDDIFSFEQIKNISTDIHAKLKQVDKNLERFKTLKITLINIEKDSRLKELIEVIKCLMPEVQVPDMVGVESVLKNLNEQKVQFTKDLDQLKPYLEKV